MKQTIIIISAIMFVNITLYSQNSQYEKYENTEKYLLGDNVNIRNAPNTNAAVVAVLPIGTFVTIIRVCDEKMKLKNYQTNWLEVSFLHDGVEKSGYVWGGLVATECYIPNNDEYLMFLYGIEEVSANKEKVKVQIRVAKYNKQLDKVVIDALGSLGTFNGISVEDDRGVAGITNILKLRFSDDMCAGAFGNACFFWHQNKLTHLRTLVEGHDAPCYSEEKFIFPKDEDGESGKIIFTFTAGCYDDETDELELYSDERKEFKWDGSKLVEI